jgi:hypothetical protein
MLVKKISSGNSANETAIGRLGCAAEQIVLGDAGHVQTL